MFSVGYVREAPLVKPGYGIEVEAIGERLREQVARTPTCVLAHYIEMYSVRKCFVKKYGIFICYRKMIYMV